MRAKILADMLRGECGGRYPRNLQRLRDTKAFEQISEMCGLDVEGRALDGKSPEIGLGKGPDYFSIRDLFENLVVYKETGEAVGPGFIQRHLVPGADTLYEAGGAMGAVDHSMFMGVTGQLLVVKVLEGSKREDFIASNMIPTYQTPLEQERIPGVALPRNPDRNVLRVEEGQPFPTVGYGEQYVETPLTAKEGLIIPVTKEAIFFDRTGLVAKTAADVGYQLGLSKEKEALGCVIGGTKNPLRFVEKRQFDSAPVTVDLYQNASGTGPYQLVSGYADRPYGYTNDLPTNTLVDYKSIKACESQFDGMVDPNTGEPMLVGNPFVFACASRKMDIAQVLQAENIFKISQGALGTTDGAIMTYGSNPVKQTLGNVEFQYSRQLKAQLIAQLSLSSSQADEAWFYGDFKEAFQYNENWPITVVQAPANSEAEFNQDIILRWKASRRGTYSILQPRAVIRNAVDLW